MADDQDPTAPESGDGDDGQNDRRDEAMDVFRSIARGVFKEYWESEGLGGLRTYLDEWGQKTLAGYEAIARKVVDDRLTAASNQAASEIDAATKTEPATTGGNDKVVAGLTEKQLGFLEGIADKFIGLWQTHESMKNPLVMAQKLHTEWPGVMNMWIPSPWGEQQQAVQRELFMAGLRTALSWNKDGGAGDPLADTGPESSIPFSPSTPSTNGHSDGVSVGPQPTGGVNEPATPESAPPKAVTVEGTAPASMTDLLRVA